MHECKYCGQDTPDQDRHLLHDCRKRNTDQTPDAHQIVARNPWRFLSRCCERHVHQNRSYMKCAGCGCKVRRAELVDKKQ